jgi:integration host factor subunit alpha
MALTKADIAESISTECGYPKTKSTELIETILEIIGKKLSSGENVLISGFGKFSVNEKNERRGRNPATGNDLTIEARTVATFRCSPVLKEKLNGKG